MLFLLTFSIAGTLIARAENYEQCINVIGVDFCANVDTDSGIAVATVGVAGFEQEVARLDTNTGCADATTNLGIGDLETSVCITLGEGRDFSKGEVRFRGELCYGKSWLDLHCDEVADTEILSWGGGSTSNPPPVAPPSPRTGGQFLENATWTNRGYFGSMGNYFADVTGDGLADAIVVNEAGVTVRRSG